MNILTAATLAILFNFSTLALVDYSPKSSSSNGGSYNPVTTRPSAPARSERSVSRAQTSSSSSDFWAFLPEYYDFSLGYVANKSFITDENINFVNFNLKMGFAHGIFIDLSARGAQSLETSEFEQANSGVKLGFNWLEIGNDYNKLIIDTYLGMRFKGDSEFSTQRNDRLLGVSTEKRFGAVALGVDYERVFADTLDNDEEMAVGDISHIKANLGIMVSHEIQFLLTYGEVKVSSSDFFTANSLNSDLKYSYLMPQMFLRMSRSVRLNMGAGFQVSRPDTSVLNETTKLWDLPVLYGNTLFAGLNLSI
ncbi:MULTISPECIES: hypothetical protein [unclassified Halobacteriovorax]|uniref:hypothetical protein n=1 Tax=unclassified Halobacteriovorax TaxID=2639665 RepID=UPI00399BD52F